MALTVTQNGPRSIDQVKTYFEMGSLFLSPEEYQREGVWDLRQKQLLIDTVFRGYDVPKLYLWKIDEATVRNGYPSGETRNEYLKILERKRRENNDPNPYVFEVVDGQQRIRAFLEYMGASPGHAMSLRGRLQSQFGALSDTPLASERLFGQLNPEQQIRFREYSLTIMVLENASIDEIRDMFLRLQNGTPLNAQQKRNALGSRFGREARTISELPFFATSVAFENSSSDHIRVASQMLLLEVKGKLVSCTSRQLDKVYMQYMATQVDSEVCQKARRTVRLLGLLFPEKCVHLNRSYALTMYWIISRLSDTYYLEHLQFDAVRNNFIALDIRRLEAMQRDYTGVSDQILEDLSDSMSRGTDGIDGIDSRHEILMQFLFDTVVLIPRPSLDPRRTFTQEEKLIVYGRCAGRCSLSNQGQTCGRDIPFDESAVDHVVPHSQGGATSLENARLAHRLCNISRGIQKDFDFEEKCRFARQGQ